MSLLRFGYREKVLYPSVHVVMHFCIAHLYEETLLPYFVIGIFQINKAGNRVFVHLESILNLLCESDQLVVCDIVTSEASLAWCDDVVVFEPPVQMFSRVTGVYDFQLHSYSNMIRSGLTCREGWYTTIKLAGHP